MTIGIDIDNTIVNTSDISNYCLKKTQSIIWLIITRN